MAAQRRRRARCARERTGKHTAAPPRAAKPAPQGTRDERKAGKHTRAKQAERTRPLRNELQQIDARLARLAAEKSEVEAALAAAAPPATSPKELGGDSGPGTNPEQLFAAGYSACFIGAMKAVAAKQKIKLPAEVSIKSEVSIGPLTGKEGAFGIAVSMAVSVPGMDKADAEALVKSAHEVCPYSNATRGNVDVKLSVA